MNKKISLDILNKRIRGIIMKAEIKEILDGLNVAIKHKSNIKIDFKECKKIVDYITYLQEENEKLKSFKKSLINMDYGIGGLHCKDNQQVLLERIDNIINELEKWANENCIYRRDIYGYETEDKVIFLEDFLDKLKELKGENNG